MPTEEIVKKFEVGDFTLIVSQTQEWSVTEGLSTIVKPASIFYKLIRTSDGKTITTTRFNFDKNYPDQDINQVTDVIAKGVVINMLVSQHNERIYNVQRAVPKELKIPKEAKYI